MKNASFLLGILLALVPSTIPAAEIAQARAYCLSLRFFGTIDQDDNYSLNLSSLTNKSNGELQPFHYFFNPTNSHGAYLTMEDLWIGGVYYHGGLDLNVPDGVDANGNGYPDFFEIARPASGTTLGYYSVGNVGTAPVSASWSRSAGERFGTCTMIFTNTVFGDLKFIATFELIEYSGPLTYTPGSDTVVASVNLVQTGGVTNTLQGPLSLAKTATNRVNTLILQPGGWTNASAQTLVFTNSTIYRNETLQSNYTGYLVFRDGDLNTSEADYCTWRMSVNDLNDTNHNGIPDFSDDLPSTQPRQPVLILTRGATNLLLTISGDVGRTNLVQETTSPNSTNWNMILSFRQTNDPQTFPLPLPASPTFWRVRVSY